ncbi:MAG: FAD-dependent oxidoreductase [Labilithrix sp.]|nr:FAD-dependent oxidoreductase [Labilithrix sp.]MCW5809637.1 FAD-dependent oxidoreductase [Labilithrix sp.]
MSGKRYIIIGDGAAGTTAAQALRASDPQATIAILSDDPQAAYYRAALTNFLLGELREEQVWAVPPSFYDELAIHRVLSRVAKIDTERRHVLLAQGGRPLSYDALLIASGARARPPTFEGALLPGVMVMRTLQDVHKVFDLIKLRGLRSAVICGGGPLALEWAHGLTHRGVKVMMVVRDRKFLPTAIDTVSSDLVLARLRQGGVEVRMGDEVTHAMPGREGRVAGVVLKSGERVSCELVGVAFGVICNSEFLQGTPVALAKSGGVITDDQMRTSIPTVCAAGDVAAVNGKLLQLWEPARMQARVAAATMLGRTERYQPGVHYMATRLYDLDVASIGEVAQTPQGAEEIVDFPQRTGQISYKKLCLRDNRVIGALLFGERAAAVRRHGRAFKKLIDSKADVSSIKGELLDAAFDLSAWIKTQELVDKPKVAAVTLASAARMKGTHAINLADLPPLPSIKPESTNDPGPATVAAALAINDPALNGLVQAVEPPRVRLEAPFGFIEITSSSTIGRDPSVPVPLQDPGVSWKHAELTIAGQFVYVRDLGSATGTWVNGAPVAAPKKLKDGERIKVGSTELVVRIQLPASAPQSVQLGAAQATGEPKPHLDVLTGNSLGLGFELVHPQEVIGRDASCTIRLDDEWIDARHAWIRKTPAGFELADAESRGVTKKNGQELTPNQWVPIAPGDTIEVGEVRMTFTMRPAVEYAGLYGPASVHGSVAGVMPTPTGPGVPAASRAPLPPGISHAPPTPQVGYAPPSMAPSGRPSGLPAMPAVSMPGRPSHVPPPSLPVGPPSMLQHARSSHVPPPSAYMGPPSMHARVRGRVSVQRGPNTGSVAELGDVTVIGSQPAQSTLALPDPYLGPMHLELRRLPDGFYVRDLGAASGTVCRGKRLGPHPFKLANGDILILGPNVQILFEAAP